MTVNPDAPVAALHWGMRVRDMTDFGKLEPGDAVSQIRAFLPSIGSLVVESDDAPERVPLDATIAAGLSNDEIERIADAYGKSSAWQTVREGSQERENGREARAVCGFHKRKRPTGNGWALNSGGAVPR